MSTLYRDYRPQNFKEILGQKHIKITLQNEIATNKLAQAFLFCGPRAVGKTTLARVLAKSVNCLNRQAGESEPCGTCTQCQSITAGNNLDVIEIDAASNTGVDNVRENIISFSRLSPSNSNYKVFIIDEVHMLSPSAFNALLKIIEEPPSYVIFILCTTEIHKVPATIISRCERFDFKRISVVEVVTKLKRIAENEKIEIDEAVLEAVARKSGGHLRDAESLLGQVFSLGDKRISLEQAELVIPHYNNSEAVDFIEHLSKKDAIKALSLINLIADSGINIRNFNSEVIALLRKLLITKISPELSTSLGLNLGDNLELRLNNVSSSLSIENIISYTRRLLAAYNEKNQLISQLPLELATIEICAGLNQVPVNRPASVSTAPVSNTLQNTKASVVKKELEEQGESRIANLGLNLDHQMVMEKWPEFLVKIKKHNHSLSFVLQNCEPKELKEGCLNLSFRYKFHQDRIKDSSIKRLVEEVLAEVFGEGVVISSCLDENLNLEHNSPQVDAMVKEDNSLTSEKPVAKNISESGAMMDNLLKAFGGEVIG